MKRMLLLIAALCMFASEAAATCDEPKEAQQIAKFSDKVSRRGDELFFKLKDGTVVSRKSSPGGWPGACDCEGNTNVAYTFYDFVDPWYVIRLGYYEESATQFINRNTGAVKWVDGHASFSPDKSRFITTAYGAENEPEIWKLSSEGIASEVDFEDARDVRWTGPSTLDIANDVKVIARLKHDGASWRCSGASRICNTLEFTSPSNSDADAHAAKKASRWLHKRDPETKEVISTMRRPKKRSHDLSPKETSSEMILTYTALNGDPKAVESLLEKGADIDEVDEDGWTALERASFAGQLEVVKLLLKKGARLQGKHDFGIPLIVAASQGEAKVVSALLDSGADINARGANGRTALMEAAWKPHPEMVKLLLSRGANVNARDDYCSTAFSGRFNAYRTDKSPEVIKLLVDNGADANARDYRGGSALSDAAEEGKTDLVKLFLERGADVNAKNNKGTTALMSAALEGRLETVRLLLDSGAEVGREGRALTWAASRGHYDVVKLLLDRGAEVNSGEKVGHTALMAAVQERHLEVVRILLAKGADVNIKDKYGWTALTWAADPSHLEVDPQIVKLLKDRGAEMTLTAAACLGDLKEARRLISVGVDINAQGENGTTALMCGVQGGYLEVVKLLLDKGADMNIMQGFCWTALTFARNKHHKEIERLLKARGAKD